MTYSSTFLKRKPVSIISVIALVISATALVAQNIPPKKEVAPARTGQEVFGTATRADLHKLYDGLVAQQNIHDPATFFSNNFVTDCDRVECKTFYITAYSAPLFKSVVPDQVIFFNNTTKKVYGSLDSRDFKLGKQTGIKLPVGSYDVIAKHHMYEDVVYKGISELVVSENNLGEVVELSFNFTFDHANPIFSTSSVEKTGIHISGHVADAETGEPLAGVTVRVKEFYPNYNGDRDIFAVTDDHGFFFSQKVIPFPTEDNILPGRSSYSGMQSEDQNIVLEYELPGYVYDRVHSNGDPKLPYETWMRDAFSLFDVAVMKRRGAEIKPNNYRGEIRKLRHMENQTEFFDSAEKLLSCTSPTDIKVGINCTSCSGGCNVYTYNGSSNLNFEKYVRAVLKHEWISETWGTYSGGDQALNAGAVAVKTVAAYWRNKVPPLNANYHIGADVCWQVFKPAYYEQIMSNNASYPKAKAAVEATAGWFLRNSTSFPKSEFAAETNDNLSQGNCNSNYNSNQSCGDGHFQKSNTGYPGGCYPSYGIDYVSLGFSDCQNSHPRGMSQRGTFRWATGKYISNTNVIGSNIILPAFYGAVNYCIKDWKKILAHYYPYYTLENCSTGEVITLSNICQACNGTGPNLTDGGSSRTTNGTRTINITAAIKNTGCSNVGPASFTTRFFLSNDIYLGNDNFLVNLNYNNWTILPNGSYSYPFIWVIPSSIPAGWYYLIETIDYNNIISETYENDNSWYFAGSFYVPPAFSGDADDRSNIIDAINLSYDTNETGTSQTDMSSVVPICQSLTSIPQSLQTTCTTTVNGFSVTVSPVDPTSSYVMANSLGQIICQGKATSGIIQCSVNTVGIYFLTVVDGAGNKCTQKVLVE